MALVAVLAATNGAQQGGLRFNCDWAAFKELRAPGALYEEVYVAVPYQQLSFTAKGAGWLAAYKLRVRLLSPGGQVTGQREWESVVCVDSLQESERQTSLEVVGFVVRDDSVHLDMEVEDLNSRASGSLQTWVRVPSFADSAATKRNRVGPHHRARRRREPFYEKRLSGAP